jgi:VWFA-related protein
MVVLTDGLDNHSDGTIQDVVRDAQRNDVVIYAIRYGRQYESQIVLGHYYFAPDAEAVLKKLTLPTGGRVFPPAYGRETLAKVYETIRQDLQSQYRMEYVPPKSKPGKYHSIYLRTKDSRMTVYAREGYYSPQ